MESGDLKIFQAVAREGSITKAAQMLNYVQSNVTARVHNLEEDLNIRLFHRTNRGMKLTAAGENLLQYADQVLSLLDQAEKSTRMSRQPKGAFADRITGNNGGNASGLSMQHPSSGVFLKWIYQ
ncbi:LysR family transcriptional regulator [Bacillus subtilis]|nr:LysR family transcriptional regulator [Bacillus subtilis]